MNLASNFESVITRVEKARLSVGQHRIVKIVAATKYSETPAMESLYALGQRAFAESRVQDLATKQETFSDLPIEWHFMGRLQKNKINHLLRCEPFLMHSLDSLELAEALDKRLEANNQTLSCLLQINSAREESKTGLSPEEAPDTYREIIERFPRITLKGVMTIGAHSEDAATIQQSFETTYRIFESLQPEGARICSMGMSGDFELAICCGSNLLRLGSILFKE